MSGDVGEDFLNSAFPFLLRGPEQKAASSLWHQCNLENPGIVCEVSEMTTHPCETSWAPAQEAAEGLAKPFLGTLLQAKTREKFLSHQHLPQ